MQNLNSPQDQRAFTVAHVATPGPSGDGENCGCTVLDVCEDQVVLMCDGVLGCPGSCGTASTCSP
eukprot:1159478-Pelagomonas_calceolata.AAC.9